jgi:UDP-glucose 4-epimerase
MVPFSWLTAAIIGEACGMRIAVTGATGNVGTSVLRELAADDRVSDILGIARRRPRWELPKVRWMAADITKVDLAPALDGADVVIHLAWLIQPSRDESVTRATNVEGSARVFDAAARAGAGAVVYASSVGAYAEGPKDRRVDESWPTTGIPTSFYSRHKAAVERILDSFEAAHPEVRVVRLRPGLIFKREAASEIRRLFAGPFLPSLLVRRELIPIVPALDRLRFQAVHSYDVGEAYRLAAMNEDAQGPYNVAAEPVLDPPVLSRLLGARPVRIPRAVLRTLADISWRAHLQPTEPGWFDMALGVPIMDTTRVRSELGWTPKRTAGEALLELLDGIRDRAGVPTPPLNAAAGGPLRVREVLTGVGRTSE